MAEGIVQLTSGLYHFMTAAEPELRSERTRTEQATAHLLARAQGLAQRFSQTRQRAGQRLAATVEEVSGNLKALTAELGSRCPRQETLKARWERLAANYEALLAHIRKVRLHVPRGTVLAHIKPGNISRNVFHVSLGVMGVALYEFVLTRGQVLAVGGGILALFIALEVVRHYSSSWNARLHGKFFSKIARPGEEHTVCTSTWYLAAQLLGVFLLSQHAIELGTLALAFGDPVASIVGKRWGKKKLFRDRSYVGTLAFFVMTTVVCTAFLWMVLPDLGLLHRVLIAMAVGAAGAIAEVLSVKVNDNFSIPLVAGAVAMLFV